MTEEIQGQLTISNLAGSPDPRALAAQALDSANWGKVARFGDPDASLEVLERWMMPLKLQEPEGMVRDEDAELGFRFNGRATSLLADALRPIGMKINPALAPQQVGGWLAAMIAALSDMPPRVSIKAAQEAIHVPMKFLNEVETAIRSKAETVSARYALAKSRLEKMKREMAAASNATPKLEAPKELTPEDMKSMAGNDMGRMVLRLGLAAGHITQEQFDAAMAMSPAEERS